MFNSFHVSFIEHLDTTPTDFAPGEMIRDDSPPMWNTLSDTHATASVSPSLLPHATPPLIGPIPYDSPLLHPPPSPTVVTPSPSSIPSSPSSSLSSLTPSPPLSSSPLSSPPCRSSHLASLHANLPPQALCLLSEFLPFHDTHNVTAPSDSLDSSSLRHKLYRFRDEGKHYESRTPKGHTGE